MLCTQWQGLACDKRVLSWGWRAVTAVRHRPVLYIRPLVKVGFFLKINTNIIITLRHSWVLAHKCHSV